MANNGRIALRKGGTSASTLPEVGKIKIGEKHPEKGHPMSLDYFRATGNYANEFYRVYGDKPTKITVAFISDDIAEVCNERYECWDKGKRWGWGDGETFTIYDPAKKTYLENVPAMDANGNINPMVKALKWDTMLTLRFVLLEMRGIMGTWVFQTKAAKTSIPGITKAFDFVKERAHTIIGFPFNLLVEKKKGYNPGEVRNYPVVTLVPNFSEEAIVKVKEFLNQGGAVAEITTRMIKEAELQGLKQIGEGGAPNDAK